MQEKSKVVARFRDGRALKGYIIDFTPDRDVFHVAPPDPGRHGVEAVCVSDLKAIFFVKSFQGDNRRLKSNERNKQALRQIASPKVKVTFLDAEVLYGTTNGCSGKRNFLLTPVDQPNNAAVYVVGDSALSIARWS